MVLVVQPSTLRRRRAGTVLSVDNRRSILRETSVRLFAVFRIAIKVETLYHTVSPVYSIPVTKRWPAP